MIIRTRVDRLEYEIRKVASIWGCIIFPANAQPPDSDGTLVNSTTGELVRVDYMPGTTAAQQSAGNNIAQTLDLTQGTRQTRPLSDIRADIQALSQSNPSAWTAIWNDLYNPSGSLPRKYLGDVGPNAASIFVFDWSLYVTGPTAAQQKAGQISLAAMYTQDNPLYLVNPPFAPSVNIPGDQPST